jgi:N-acetyl-anhydromuramyl-L-alanine amidase AmpD
MKKTINKMFNPFYFFPFRKPNRDTEESLTNKHFKPIFMGNRGRVHTKKHNYEPIDTSKIKKVNFPDNEYYNVDVEKYQIVLHHTVSSAYSIDGDVNTWLTDNVRVATCVIIDYMGTVHQLFGFGKWAHHLGIKSQFLRNLGFSDYATRNQILNKHSIGIEIASPGGITYNQNNNKFYDYYGKIVDRNKYDIIEYDTPYRGYKYFVKYSQKQIDTVAELLLHWNNLYNIPLTYQEDMWNVSLNAISGKPGVWSHTSFREDKSDVHPDPDLIKMLKVL